MPENAVDQHCGACERQNQQNDVRPAKTQISLGIHLVWLESSLCAQWVAKYPRCRHADSEDSDHTEQMLRLYGVFAGRIGHFVSFVMLRLNYFIM